MADVFSREKRSDVMSRIRSEDTRPEMLVRQALHKLGYRYRLHDGHLPGKPDIVFPGRRVAVQVRGCFWHGHSCRDGHVPKSAKKYWPKKLLRNKLRDALNDGRLRRMGWRLVIVWECRCASRKGLEREIGRIASRLEPYVHP